MWTPSIVLRCLPDLGAEYIGAVGVPGASKIAKSARAESLGICGGSFARSAEAVFAMFPQHPCGKHGE